MSPIKVLIKALESCGKKCLICGTTGIALVHYPRGTTRYSLLRFGIDERFTESFRCHIGGGTSQARYILAAALIINDEVPTLAPWVASQASLAIQSISKGR
jgi:hypothetical protein